MILIDRSAAARSLTGPVNVTITGCATPTTWPLAGWIEAMPSVLFCGAIAAVLRAPEPAMASNAIPAVSHTYRIALRTVPTLRDDVRPRRLHSISLICTLSNVQQTDRKMGKSRLAEPETHELTWSGC